MRGKCYIFLNIKGMGVASVGYPLIINQLVNIQYYSYNIHPSEYMQQNKGRK